MAEEKKEKTEKRGHTENASLVGPVWYIGWLFTVAFANLGFLKAFFALVLWPYYLGSAVAGVSEEVIGYNFIGDW